MEEAHSSSKKKFLAKVIAKGEEILSLCTKLLTEAKNSIDGVVTSFSPRFLNTCDLYRHWFNKWSGLLKAVLRRHRVQLEELDEEEKKCREEREV